MSDPQDIPALIRGDALQFVQLIGDGLKVQLTYDRAGVEWVDGYIERNRNEFLKGKREGLVRRIASFVGECVCRTYGGSWVKTDAGWGVEVSPRLTVYPQHKAEKQFENGHAGGDSILGFFETIRTIDNGLATGQIGSPKQSSGPKQ